MKIFTKTRKRLTKDECKSGIYNRYLALNAACKGKAPVDPVILSGCKSMVKLAAMESPKHEIRSLGSRNTLIKYADLVLIEKGMQTPTGEKGIKFLDWLRSQVKSKGITCQPTRTTKERAKRALKREDDLTLDIRELRNSMSSMTRAYNRLLKDIADLSRSHSTDPSTKLRLQNLLDEHFTLFGKLFRPLALGDSQPANLVNIRPHEDISQ